MNRAQKKLSAVDSWEKKKKAAVESKLREIEVCNLIDNGPLSLDDQVFIVLIHGIG